MKELPFIQTSVFVDDRYSFSGNQLATFWNQQANQSLTQEEMLGITREMNFSESTFLYPSEKENCDVKVRIFTPGGEIPFAGHPTLGTAVVLKETELVPKNQKKGILELGVGPIEVSYESENQVGMMQPEPQFKESFDNQKALAEFLGIPKKSILADYPFEVVLTGIPFLMIPIDSLKTIKEINLNPQKQVENLKKLVTQEVVCFTTETVHEDSSVHVRMFAPGIGVFEDPATGSAAGPLAAYLEKWEILTGHSKGTDIVIEQGYEIHRPSKLIAQTISPNEKVKNILVSGKVKKTATGTFHL